MVRLTEDSSGPVARGGAGSDQALAELSVEPTFTRRTAEPLGSPRGRGRARQAGGGPNS